jgi:integrase
MVANRLDLLMADYLAHCRAKGLAPNTVSGAYAFPLNQVFLPWCVKQGITEPEQLTSRALDRLASDLLENGGARGPLSKATVHSYLRPINSMLAWAREEGEVGSVKAQLPRLPKTLIDVLSRDEIDRLEDSAKSERDKLIVRTLADTGIRVGELVKLRAVDVLERDRKHYLRVQGKGAKERLVPVPRLYRRLQRLIRGRPADVPTDRLFLGLKRRANHEDLEPLTESGVQQMLRNVAKVAGIGKRVHPHLLRHSFATHQLARGMNPIQLADILGHSNLVMIHRVYAHLSPSDAYEAMLRSLYDESA